MSNSEIEQSGTVKGHLPNEASLSGRISNGLSLSGHISIGGASTAEEVSYTNTQFPNVENVKGALDAIAETQQQHEDDINVLGDLSKELDKKSHTHTNKAALDKFAETDGKPTYNGEKISGASTAEEVEYTNAILPDASNVKSALDYTIDTLQTQSADTESLRAGVSALIDAYETQGGDIANLKTQAHTHSNKGILDKLSDSNGKLQYNGEALGGGAGDFIIKITVEGNYESGYTVTSCDATVEQIDAAVANEKRVVVVITVDGSTLELPMIQYAQGSSYYFGAFFLDSVIYSTVYNTGNTTSCEFGISKFQASSVGYSSNILPNISSVEEALDELISNSHTHANKYTLDKLSVSNGKLQYNGSDVGLKGDKGDTPVKGTDYWTAADKTEIVNDTLAALPTWTGGSY